MSWPKPMPIVEVEWIDSMERAGWRSADDWDRDLALDTLSCRSTGYLYREDDRGVVLMQSQAETGALADAIEIPRMAVQSVRVLRHGKARERHSA